MIDHVSLGTHKFDEAIQFYSDCLAPLGYKLEHRTEAEAAFGEGRWTFWLYPVSPAEGIVGSRTHVALVATSNHKVQQFHEIAADRGATTIRQPGPRPDISPEYFGTVIRDLDGHTLEVVHWSTAS